MNEHTTVPKKSETSRPRLFALLGLALVALGALAFGPRGSSEAAPKTDTDTLDLKVLLQAPTCKAHGAGDLQHAAQQLEQAARARMERSAFVAGEGVKAALLLSEASRCFEQAGDLTGSARSQSEWSRWHSDLASRLQGHRLRLKIALRSKQPSAALAEIKGLKALLSPLPVVPETPLSKFLHWLNFEQRRLSAEKKKR